MWWGKSSQECNVLWSRRTNVQRMQLKKETFSLPTLQQQTLSSVTWKVGATKRLSWHLHSQYMLLRHTSELLSVFTLSQDVLQQLWKKALACAAVVYGYHDSIEWILFKMITTIEPTIELDCNGQEERDTFYEKKRWDIYSYMYNDLTRMNFREKICGFALCHSRTGRS